MVPEALEKLEVSRHLIYGADWAMAGAARGGVASAVAAPARKNSRRLTDVTSRPFDFSLTDMSAT